MQLNIFRIDPRQFSALKARLRKNGYRKTATVEQSGWSGSFHFTEAPNPKTPKWIDTFSTFLPDKKYRTLNFGGTLLLKKDSYIFATSFGKAHFFIRPYCDYDFGIELAKRIGNPDDITQTSSRKYQGPQKRDITSYTSNSPLNIAPGSSVDFIQGRIIENEQPTFGKTAKFGTSALLHPEISTGEIGTFLDSVTKSLGGQERFKLPRTLILTEDDEIKKYDQLLIQELKKDSDESILTADTFELFGVDFIFNSSGDFQLKSGNRKAIDLDRITIKDIKEYIAEKDLSDREILNLKVTERRDDGQEIERRLKDAVDFICEDEPVALSAGRWLRFNEDYLDELNRAIDNIPTEETEPEFQRVYSWEDEFNKSLEAHDYEVLDKNFGVIKTKSETPVEAWDLKKGPTVYAVKFGTAQKLNYVVDQATATIEIIGNYASTTEVPEFSNYCLWLGYRGQKPIRKLSNSRSIILKQKIEYWARNCRTRGIKPVLKLSQKLDPEHDVAVSKGENMTPVD